MRLRQLVDRIVADGVITPEERDEICRAVAEDPELTDEERFEVARITEMIERGEVVLVSGAAGGTDSGTAH